MGWDDAIGDAIGDAIADAVDEILTDDDAAAEAAAAAAEAEAATAEAEAAAEAEQTGETAYDPNFPKYWSIEKDGEFWTDPLTGVIWKYLGDDQWEDTGNIPGAVDDTGGVAVDDTGGVAVDDTGGVAVDDTGGVASSSEPLPEIVSKAKLLENGFPIGATAVLVAGVLYTLIAGTAGGSGYWINSETGDAYTPGGQSIDPTVMDEIVSSGKALETVDWSKIFEGALGIAGLAGIGVPELWEMLFGESEAPSASASGWKDWLDKIFKFVQAKKAIDDYNKYEVPVGQMHAQSTVGRDWGLPTKGSMVMEDLGPNYAENMQYLMAKGKPTPAATHALGTPFVEKIQVGQQGGIMGLEGYGDITPAFLEPGEFVFTKKATDNIGAKRLYKLMKQAEQMGMGGS